MHIIQKRVRRAARRVGNLLWPAEARSLFGRGNWKALPIAAALFIYADASQACLTVPPGTALAGTFSEQEIQMMAADSAASAVHASYRPSAYPSGHRMPSGMHISRSMPGSAVERFDMIENPHIIAAEETAVPAAAPSSSTGAQPALRTPGNPSGARIALEGEFAVMLAQAMRLRAPRSGWSPSTAASFLTTLRLKPDMPQGVVPAGGWRLDRALTEGSVASLLNYLGLQVMARSPARELTVQEAETIVARIASIFRTLAPAAFTEESNPSTLELGNPRAPLSPSAP